VEEAAKTGRGTDVTLHLKEDAREFLDEWRLRSLVREFSDFIEHPVVMETGEEGKKKDEVLNSRKALWLRSKADVTPEEYKAFYQQVSGDSAEPGRVLHYTGEGTLEFRVLLFLPSHKPFDMHFGEQKVGPRLYIRRVLVMDHCEALLPPYLRFVRGVVDCSDLPLNVSREMLQQNPLLEKIQKNLVSRVLKALEEWKKEDLAAYTTFQGELGSVLKEGIGRDWSNREHIADLLLLESMKTEPGKHTSFPDYVAAMSQDQKDIFYLTGESRAALEHAPYLEEFRARGWDVLFFTDPVDEFVLPSLTDYRGKQLRPADRVNLERTEEEKKKSEEAEGRFRPLFDRWKEVLGEVKDVRVSSRLKESATCLVVEEGAPGAHMERLLLKLGAAGPEKKAERILEVNPDHPAVQALQALYASNPSDARIEGYARLLYEQAVIAEGSKVADPVAFAQRINDLLVRDAGAAASTS
jgi:molecular chaperone HtpG